MISNFQINILFDQLNAFSCSPLDTSVDKLVSKRLASSLLHYYDLQHQKPIQNINQKKRAGNKFTSF